MKLRIKGNSVRLRLTQSEVETLQTKGRVEEHTRFRPGERLVYVLETSRSATRLMARFAEGHLTVIVPATDAVTWAETDQVSLEAEQIVENDEMLSLLVEKDFQCLHRPPTERDADTFPHPLAGEEGG